MSFINIAIAHDATCKRGDEWLFHGFEANKGGLDDGGEGNDDGSSVGCGCVVAIILVAIIGIIVWACN